MATQKKSRTKRPGASPFFANIPLKVRVRPARRPYTLSPLPSEGAKKWWGDTSKSHRSIRLNKGMTSGRLADTVIHEILHAIIGERGVQTVHEAEDATLLADPIHNVPRTLTHAMEETVVYHLASGLFQVLVDNDHLRVWLFELLEHVAQQQKKRKAKE